MPSSSTIHFTPDFIKACEQLWRDGYNKGTNGEDNTPDFKDFFSNINQPFITPKIEKDCLSYEEMERLPFKPDKCHARVEKFGYGIQCTRSQKDGGCLCGLHQNMLQNLPEGATDLRYGWFNKPRPEKDFFKGETIKWGPKKSRVNKSQKKDTNTPKMKVAEMRDYLSSRIPIDDFRGLKKKELIEIYLKTKEKENTLSSEEENSPQVYGVNTENSPKSEQQEEKIEQPKGPEHPEEQPKEHEQSEEKNGGRGEQPEEQPKESEQSEDDGKGCGLSLIPEKPNTVSEYKELFDKIGIDYSNLRGSRAYKQAYEGYLKEKEEAEGEKTEPLSDDDDELQEDTNKYDETNFEGVDYLEDEDTAKVYNLKGQLVGKWNDDIDDIIWESEEFKIAHENARP